MELREKNRKRMKWAIAAIVIVLIGALSVWTILTQQANQDKSYSGAKFIEYWTGGCINGMSSDILPV